MYYSIQEIKEASMVSMLSEKIYVNFIGVQYYETTR